MSRNVGAGEWLEEYGRVCMKNKVALLLGKCVEGVSDGEGKANVSCIC